MSEFIFVLGRTTDLAFLELKSFFLTVKRVSPRIVWVSGEINPKQVIGELGGVVKIARVLKVIPEVKSEDLSEFFADTKKVIFGVSSYGSVSIKRTDLMKIKQKLEQSGINARYIEAKDGSELSSVVVDKQKVTELAVVRDGDKVIVGKTEAVQVFADWNKRDYERPWADAKSGMLPPKVARMAVNIATSKIKNQKSKLLVDPFCGMGTILGEALLCGWNVIGSDQLDEAIKKADDNLKWLVRNYPDASEFKWRVFKAEATHLSEFLVPESVDAIVTEPFMGNTHLAVKPQNSNHNDQIRVIRNLIKGLEKLYIGCLRDWVKVLKPGGRVVMAFPKWVWNKQEFFVKKVIDSCEKLGYTVSTGPLEYSRPQAVVRREFYILTRN